MGGCDDNTHSSGDVRAGHARQDDFDIRRLCRDQPAADLAVGEVLELLTDTSDALDNDIHAWTRTTGHELVSFRRGERESRYMIRKRQARPSSRRFAAVISNPWAGGAPLAARVRACRRSGRSRCLAVLPGTRRPRPDQGLRRQAGLAEPTVQPFRSVRARRGGACPRRPDDLAFEGVTVVEYLTFMANEDVHIYA